MKKVAFSIAATAISAMSLQAAVISNFDFTGAPWTVAKQGDFATFSAATGSVDTELNTTTSDLSKTAGIGSGGYASYYIRDSDLGTSIFSGTTTAGVGMNFAGVNQSTATNYISFTVTTAGSFETTYNSLSLFVGTNTGPVTLKLEAYDGATLSTPAISYSFVDLSPAGNDPITAYTFDFDDFFSSNAIEFRLYAYGANDSSTGVRLDDIVLNGSTAAVPEPTSTALLLGLACLGLVNRRKK